MKISLSKFHHEVTGTSGAKMRHIEASLKRWNVPFDPEGTTRERVDVKYLDIARAAYTLEKEARQAEAAERGVTRTNLKPRSDIGKKHVSPYSDLREEVKVLRSLVEAQAQALGRVEDVTNKMLKIWT